MPRKLTASAKGATTEPKKRGRKAAADGVPASSPMTNVTDETIREFNNKALEAQKEWNRDKDKARSSKGKFDAVLSEAKKAGVPVHAIHWWLDNKDRDPAEIDRETAERNRIAKLMNMPIGTQLGFLAGQLTVATAIENDNPPLAPATEEQRSAAYSAGYHALDDDSKSTMADNPHPEGTAEHAEWKRGWLARQSDNVDALAKKAATRMPKARGNGTHAPN